MSRSLPVHLQDDSLKKIVKKVEGEDVEVEIVSVKGGLGQGENYGSGFYILDLKTKKNGSSKPLSLVAKSYISSEFHEFIMNAYVIFQKEIELYKETVPIFVELERKSGTKNVTEVFPECYYALWDERNSIIILENLKTTGFTMADRKDGLDLEHSKVALSALAKLHSLSFVLKHDCPEEFKKVLKTGREAQYTESRRKFFTDMCTNVEKEVLEMVSQNPSLKPHYDRIQKAFDAPFDKLKNSCNPDDRLSVFTHGDYWVNNMLFSYENRNGKQVPAGVKIVDFQMTRVASLALDINFFLYTSTTKQLRDKYLEDMLRSYHTTFTDCLKSLGKSPDELTFDALKQELRDKSIFGLLVAAFMLRPICADAEAGEVPDLQDLPAEAFATTLPPVGKLYKTRALDMVLEFVEKNYI